MSQAAILSALPEPLQRLLDPAQGAAARLPAAKGLVPVPPRQLLMLLAGLSLDADPALQAAACATLASLPERLVLGALSPALPPPVLAALLPPLQARAPVLQQLVLEAATPDDALVPLAAEASANIAELLASNQARCLRCPELVRALHRNPNLSPAHLQRLVDFLVRAGQVDATLPSFDAALARLTSDELQLAVAQVELPAEFASLLQDDPAAAGDAAAPVDADVPEPASAPEAEAEAEEPAPEAEPEEPGRIPMQKLVGTLSAAQKVALAMKGNREARSILVRDSNRVVCTAAIRNPRITEQEIVVAAKNRSINDEVIRIICASRDMTRSYGVRWALVNNPKTPLTVSLRYLTSLRQSDLKAVAKSKGIASALVGQAKRMLTAKNG